MVNLIARMKLKDLSGSNRKIAVNSLGVFNKTPLGMNYLHIDVSIDSYEEREKSTSVFADSTRLWEHELTITGELDVERSTDGLSDSDIEEILEDPNTKTVLYSNIRKEDVYECVATLATDTTETNINFGYETFGGMLGIDTDEMVEEEDPIETLLYGRGE